MAELFDKVSIKQQMLIMPKEFINKVQKTKRKIKSSMPAHNTVLKIITRRLYYKDSPDPLTQERGNCLEKDCKTKKMLSILKECEKRVNTKEYTAETCSQEVVDLVQALDHCVGRKAFDKFV